MHAWDRILSDFVPIDELLGNGVLGLFPERRTKVLKRALVVQPLSKELRRSFWLQYCTNQGDTGDDFSIYSHYVALGEQLPSASLSEIQRDVVRTLPGHPAFSSKTHEGQINRDKLQRILIAVSAAETAVGYCQGMNFIVATLLVNLDYSETDAFHMFISILNDFHFKHLFSPEVPLLPLRMFHFSRLVRTHLPNVWHHLNAKTYTGVEIFANQWIMTLFAYYLEPEILGRVWDLFFLLGWKYIFQFGLTILKLIEPELCKMDVEEISAFMSSSRNGNSNACGVTHPFTDPNLIQEQLLLSLDAFHITNGQLELLSRQFMNQKIMTAVGELAGMDDKQVAMAPTVRTTVNDMYDIKPARTAGFAWVYSKEAYSPSFLQVDLISLDTPNRPCEKLNITQPTIWLPIKSLLEIKISTTYIESTHQNEANRMGSELAKFERELVAETHVLAGLQGVVANTEQALKEAAKKKYLTNRSLKSATPPSAELEKRVKAADTAFIERKQQRDSAVTQMKICQQKVNELTQTKNEKIREITESFSKLEDTQNDIISRSIQSALVSFSNRN